MAQTFFRLCDFYPSLRRRTAERFMEMAPDHKKRMRISTHFNTAIVMENEPDPIPAEMINLGMTGILDTSQPSFHKDASSKVILSLADETRIVVDSKILRVGAQETAISFVSMDEDSFIPLKEVAQYNTLSPTLSTENSRQTPSKR
jgi:hypothetical protein